MYLGYEPNTVPKIAGKDECVLDMNWILYLGLLERMNLLGITTGDSVPGIVGKDECIRGMNRIL